MIPKDPQQRLTIKEAVQHPYFWDDERRDTFLNKVGDEEDVQNKRKSVSVKLRNAVDKYTTFSDWKPKITEVVKQEEGVRLPDKSFKDDLLGLMRYLRNLLVHKKDVFYQNNRFKDLFQDFFISAHKLAKEMGWRG
ncbi:2-5A-dependent ribonuclease-like [Colossoma macropomum]|uniref:2-5A-dependent ribonuclease-like n=1 Tax=Colossoma macropomum TaxID=42526 RepID=UPI001864EF79|nr:2-5A-dependent ribonuclease-like [Colossoma macropomum]